MDPTLKIFEDVYFVLKMGIFHYYVVSLLEGKVFQLDPLCFEGSVFFFSVAKAGNSHFTLMSCGFFFSRKHFQCLNLIFRSRSEQISKHHLSFKDFLAFCTQTNSWDIWFQFDQWHSFFNWVLNREKHPQKHITIGSDIQWHPIPLAHKSVKIRGVFFGAGAKTVLFPCLYRCSFNRLFQVYSPTPDFVSGVALNFGCTSIFFWKSPKKSWLVQWKMIQHFTVNERKWSYCRKNTILNYFHDYDYWRKGLRNLRNETTKKHQ